jgi:hypothetical protein
VPQESFIDKNEARIFASLNQGVQFWFESVNNSVPNFVEDPSLSQAQPKQIRDTTHSDNGKNPNQRASLDGFDDVHVFVLFLLMGLPMMLWVIFWEPNGPGVRHRPQKYQETPRVVSGVRTSRLLGIGFTILTISLPEFC